MKISEHTCNEGFKKVRFHLYNKNFNFVLLLKSFVAKALNYGVCYLVKMNETNARMFH